MYKVTANRPHTQNVSSVDAKLHTATRSAIDHYLSPSGDSTVPQRTASSNLFSASPRAHIEKLLVSASETRSSTNEIATKYGIHARGP